LKLKAKKIAITEQINNLKQAFGKSYLEQHALMEAKKFFSRYDESLDKISEDIFEMERSYQNEYPQNYGCQKSNSKVSQMEGETSFNRMFNNSPKVIKRTYSDNNL